MKELHELYRKLQDEGEGKPHSPLVMTLDNKIDRAIIQAHIKTEFGESLPLDAEKADDVFLEAHRLANGELECTILLEYHNGQSGHSVYVEAAHLGEAEVQAVLGNLGPDDTLHVHLKGADYQEVAAKLRSYFVTHHAEPEEPHEKGAKYQDDGYLCIDAEVQNPHGLHMRPAGKIVKAAWEYDDETEIFLQLGDQEAEARSILGLMVLGAEKGERITIKTKGPDAEEALSSLYRLMETGLGEE